MKPQYIFLIFTLVCILMVCNQTVGQTISGGGNPCINANQNFYLSCSSCEIIGWSVTGPSTFDGSDNDEYLDTFSWTSAGTYTVSVNYIQYINGNRAAGYRSLDVTINPPVTPSLIFSQLPNNSTCAGSLLTFTASIANGGTSPVFTFYVNDLQVQSGSSNTYQNNSLVTGDVVKVIVSTNAACQTVSSVQAAITINRYTVTPPVISGRQVSYYTSTTFSMADPGNNESYRWYFPGMNSVTGLTFSTPVLTTDVSLSVTKINLTSNCESSSTSVPITLTVPPPVISDGSNNTCGPKQIGLVPRTDNASVYWHNYPSGTTHTSSNQVFSNSLITNASGDYFLRAYVPSLNRWSSDTWVKANVNPIDITVTRYDNANKIVQATHSIRLLPGFSTQSNEFIARIAITDECNNVVNWTEQILYDQSGSVIADVRDYMDGFGSQIQSQSIDFLNTKVWVNQPIWNELYTPVGQTLTAPILENGFIYKENFVRNESGNTYSASDHDVNKLYSPNPVGEQNGTLGWYYSASNNVEPLVATTNFPYTRQWVEPGPDPTMAKSSGLGDALKMGSGHESRSERQKVANGELDHYYSIRHLFTNSPIAGNDDLTEVNAPLKISQFTEVGYAYMTFGGLGNLDQVIPSSSGNGVIRSGIMLRTNINVIPGKSYIYSVKGQAADATANLFVKATGGADILWTGAALPTNKFDYVHSTFVVPSGVTSISIGVLWSSSVASDDVIWISEIDLKSATPSTPGYKSITTDAEGNQSVTFTDADGLTLASATLTNGVYDNWSYNFYNETGQLIASVAPKGVNTASTAMPSFVTTYKYDHLGRLIETNSPDEGLSQFVYSKDGKIRFSQNQEQREATPARFSYTNYDFAGRLIEAGEYTQSAGGYIFEPSTQTSPAINSILTIVDNDLPEGYDIESLTSSIFTGISKRIDATRCTDFSFIKYDFAATDVPGGAVQRELLGQVSKTENENAVTWYSYDEFGQLEWSKQRIKTGDPAKIYTIDYKYDYFGNVTEVGYQRGISGESFYHYYHYDNNQRLTKVFTSTNGSTQTLQAEYFYYLHGPLKRVELGDNVQGIDYVYNLDGSLKFINHSDPAKDPGKDGISGENSAVAKDVFGEAIDYYNNDYQSAGYDAGTFTSLSQTDYPQKYNGAIRSVRWHSQVDNHTPRLYAYKYDRLNQMDKADWGSISGSGNYTATIESGKYVEDPAYDKNGNITTMVRKGKNANTIADFGYTYQTGTNKLTQITQPSSPSINYQYNKIGQMVQQDEGSKGLKIVYNAYGLVKEIRDPFNSNKLRLKYEYDDRGDLCRKLLYDASEVLTGVTTYVNDVSGNVMAIYYEDKAAALPTLQIEVPIFGSGRVAIYKPQVQTIFYEVADHLGNIRGVIGKPAPVTFVATMEDNGSATYSNPRVQELAFFKNLSATEADDDVYMNHTAPSSAMPSPNYSAYLKWISGMTGQEAKDKSVGPAIMLKVEPGDKLNTNVSYKYKKKTTYSNNAIQTVMASILGANYLGAASGLDVLSKSEQVFSNGLAYLGGNSVKNSPDNTLPYAYLNVLVFDKLFNVNQTLSRPVRVTTAGGFLPGEEIVSTHGQLLVSQFEITEPGYVYIFVSNESENTEVWFDDLSITNVRANVVAGADYYPFGLAMEGREMTREDYRYGYQGQYSEEDETTGWNMFELRNYDARIGRMNTPDPYGQFASSYMAMGNTPHMSVDPDGGYSIPIGIKGALIGAAVGAGIGLAVDKDNWGWYALGGAAVGSLAGTKFFRSEVLGHYEIPGVGDGVIARNPTYPRWKTLADLNVPNVAQANYVAGVSNWCGFACGEALSTFFGIARTQFSLAASFNASRGLPATANVGLSQGVDRATGKTYSEFTSFYGRNFPHSTNFSTSLPSPGNITKALRNGSPISGSIRLSGTSQSHNIIIRGIKKKIVGRPKYKLHINDPAPGKSSWQPMKSIQRNYNFGLEVKY